MAIEVRCPTVLRNRGHIAWPGWPWIALARGRVCEGQGKDNRWKTGPLLCSLLSPRNTNRSPGRHPQEWERSGEHRQRTHMACGERAMRYYGRKVGRSIWEMASKKTNNWCSKVLEHSIINESHEKHLMTWACHTEETAYRSCVFIERCITILAAKT